jgi:hypothetical protein
MSRRLERDHFGRDINGVWITWPPERAANYSQSECRGQAG